ncbi:MAG: hypothetical protein M0C28_18660 [Candidatus Moduliflexus flocculans]|nr:hypothetical protein [Candidatus Moduliflexus flocculans]
MIHESGASSIIAGVQLSRSTASAGSGTPPSPKPPIKAAGGQLAARQHGLHGERVQRACAQT